MSKHVVEYDCECEACKATGLYVGFAEKNGAAVVCRNCGGTGKQHVKFTYNDFEGRRSRKNIKRVFQVNPGIWIGTGETKAHEKLKLKYFGGMPYEDWFAGKLFPEQSEMRRFVCPAWWYQSVDCNKKPNWDECSGYGSFPDCKHFKNKTKCWKQWDAEHKKKKRAKAATQSSNKP